MSSGVVPLLVVSTGLMGEVGDAILHVGGPRLIVVEATILLVEPGLPNFSLVFLHNSKVMKSLINKRVLSSRWQEI